MPDAQTLDAPALGRALSRAGWRLAVAESCTGGWLARDLTAVAGCSSWFERGLVTYSNEAKEELLGVPETVIKGHGAVSEATALAMANGLIERAPVDLTVAITGVAGPDGGTPDKPVGTVWIAWRCREAEARARRFQFDGDRSAVREQSVAAALVGCLDEMREHCPESVG